MAPPGRRGASGIGFATWSDTGAPLGGRRLPGLTDNNGNGGIYDRATDAAVAYDAAHNVWILSTRSTNGGETWLPAVQIGANITHAVSGNLRDGGGLPTAEIDGAGKVYVVWQDCRFRKGCKTNDLVMSTSTDGATWSAVQRIPIDSTTSGVDHFLPGIGVDVGTSGTTAKLGLTYYFYRNGRCGRRTCQLEVGYSQSNDGGATSSGLKTIAGPFLTTSAPLTTQGYMVADYISTSWSGGKAFSAFPVADAAPVGGAFDLPLKSELAGLTPATGAFTGSTGDRAIPGAAADHASPRSHIRLRRAEPPRCAGRLSGAQPRRQSSSARSSPTRSPREFMIGATASESGTVARSPSFARASATPAGATARTPPSRTLSASPRPSARPIASTPSAPIFATRPSSARISSVSIAPSYATSCGFARIAAAQRSPAGPSPPLASPANARASAASGTANVRIPQPSVASSDGAETPHASITQSRIARCSRCPPRK